MNHNVSPNVVELAKALTVGTGSTVVLPAILEIGSSEKRALDWDFAATPNLQVVIKQANAQAPATAFTKWATDLTALVPTNDFALTTTKGGSNLRLSDSKFATVTITNNGASPLLINFLRMLLS